MERSFVVTLARYRRNDPDTYVLQGYFQGNSIAGCHMYAYWDREEIPLKTSCREGLAVRQKYHMNILAIRKNGQVIPMPGPAHQFSRDERIILLGGEKDVQKFLRF